MLSCCKTFSAVFLLATTALASPVANVLHERDCPAPTLTTTTLYKPTQTLITGLTTLTDTFTLTYTGRITSTTREVYSYLSTVTKTIYPDVTTIPVTTVYATVTAPPRTRNPYGTITLTTTLPGTPEPCYILTCTQLITDATTATYPTLYAYETKYFTEHVTTLTSFKIKTTTETSAAAKTTKALSTVTITNTYTPEVITIESTVKTVYATPGPAVCG
ncbi:hypothetical protein TWF281_005182 [Arthrobotrys megalospora]